LKKNTNGYVSDVEFARGRVYVAVAELGSLKGYPYFTKYSVSVAEEDDKFVVSVR